MREREGEEGKGRVSEEGRVELNVLADGTERWRRDERARKR